MGIRNSAYKQMAQNVTVQMAPAERPGPSPSVQESPRPLVKGGEARDSAEGGIPAEK